MFGMIIRRRTAQQTVLYSFRQYHVACARPITNPNILPLSTSSYDSILMEPLYKSARSGTDVVPFGTYKFFDVMNQQETMYCDSTKRKRSRKMNKHKYRKFKRRMRNRGGKNLKQ